MFPLVRVLHLSFFAAAWTVLAVGRAAAPAEWVLKDAALDPALPGPDGQPSIKVLPGGRAELRFSEEDVSGKVTLFVRDDLTVALSAKGRGVGPRWGLRSSTGRVLVGGIMYAPYFAPEGSVALMETEPDSKDGWFKAKYLGKRGGKKGPWQEWVFDFNPETGLTIAVDGKQLPAKRFDWQQSRMGGMDGIVLFGDETGRSEAQTIWIGGVSYATGPVVAAQPAGPPADGKKEDSAVGAGVVPPADPAPDGKMWEMIPAARATHPRLILNREKISALREFYSSEEGALWRRKMENALPVCKPEDGAAFLTDATDGQRQGFWRLPTVALHAALTGDQTSVERTKAYLQKFLDLPHWETGKEQDSGMSAANIMVGAALAYDWIHDQLDPAFREKFRGKLLHQARALYHGGHLMKNPGPHYWQSDPANNHRWHRNAGLALALFAVYEGRPEEQWIMQRAMEELAFVNRWLPHDGSCHEGPNYFTFGGNHLTLAMQSSDQLMGTDFLDGSYFRNMGNFRLHSLLPGMKGIFSFGDGRTTALGQYNNFLLSAASRHGQADIRDGLLCFAERNDGAFSQAWFSLLWDDPKTPRGDRTRLPTKALFDDIGFVAMRDGWGDQAVGASFLCGPLGGFDLNRYRNEGETEKRYINVAHDDPNALEFLIARGGELLAAPDGYSEKKASQNHNTILINGMGQRMPGRGEGAKWSQPGGDMIRTAYLTAYRSTDKVTAVEGEASGAYGAVRDKKSGLSRPAMERVRRAFLWVEGDYVLSLDEIVAPEAVETAWLVQGPDLVAEHAAEGRFLLKGAGESVPFQIAASSAITTEIRISPADDRGKSLNLRQLVATVRAPSVRIGAVFDAWNRGGIAVTLADAGDGASTVVVRGPGFEDVWTWRKAPDNETASTLVGERKQGDSRGFPFSLDDRNNAIVWKRIPGEDVP